MGTKWHIEKFTRDNDFGLWKVNMQAVLIQQKCAEALKDESVLSITILQLDQIEMEDHKDMSCLLPYR